MNSTPLDKHRRKGKRLVPPFGDLPKISPEPWKDNRLPEMIWASLVFTGIQRETALELFRRMAFRIKDISEPKWDADITLSGLSNLPEEKFLFLLSEVLRQEDIKACLEPLLLLEEMPGRSIWHKALGAPRRPEQDLWNALSKAVLETIDHQSETSTDCRWIRLICEVMGGRLRLPDELLDQLINFPKIGDLREVRPFIRASEISLDSMENKTRDWSKRFWMEMWRRTRCSFGSSDKITPQYSRVTTTRQLVEDVYANLCNHAVSNFETTGVEIKAETIFGLGLYGLALTDDILASASSERVLGRLALRTIVEIYITLKYLITKNDPSSWVKYRDFGSGQAKLAKLKSLEGNFLPNFMDLEKMRFIANEDRWDEFLTVNIGHWEDMNLRSMSIEVGVKEIYDMYYEWSSTYSHAHWGAIREHCYNICFNPLHKGHRIPSLPPNLLPDALPDIVSVIDKILDLISNEFPIFRWRIGIYRI